MSGRVKLWLLGLSFTALLGVVLSWNLTDRDLILPIGLIAIGLIALIAETGTLRTTFSDQSPWSNLQRSRSPDGVVEVVAVEDIARLDCQAQSTYRQFAGLLPRSGSSSPLPELPITRSPLLGQVVLISVFVGRDGVSWSDVEIASGHEALERSGVWIEREAIRHGASVNIGLADVYFRVNDESDDPVEVGFWPEGNDVGPMEAHAATKAVVMASRAAASLGFADVADWMRQINARVAADSSVWLFHVRSRGRSHAIVPGNSGVEGVDFAVCFAKESSFPEPLNGRVRFDPSTLAHEVLHLFGASDKYGVGLRSFPEGSVSSREIMRLNSKSLSQMTIDRLTAVEIGWLKSTALVQNQRKRPSPSGLKDSDGR